MVEADPAGVASKAADLVQNYLRSTSEPVLGLATGATVEGLYAELVHRFARGRLSFAGARAVLLDEYVGLGYGHPQRYSNVIRRQLTDHVDLAGRDVCSPDGDARDLAEECVRYEALVRRARVGLQILGIGRNGHLAFNEPGSSFDSRTRVVRLAEDTRAANARHFGGPRQVPRYAVTQGLATISRAAHLLVLAGGRAKAEAVREALEGPIGAEVPARLIRRRPRVTVLLDPEAARLIRYRRPSQM